MNYSRSQSHCNHIVVIQRQDNVTACLFQGENSLNAELSSISRVKIPKSKTIQKLRRRSLSGNFSEIFRNAIAQNVSRWLLLGIAL